MFTIAAVVLMTVAHASPLGAEAADVPETSVSASDNRWEIEPLAQIVGFFSSLRSFLASIPIPDQTLAEDRLRVMMAIHLAGVRLDTLAAANTTPAEFIERIDDLIESADVTALLENRGGSGQGEVHCRGRVCQVMCPSEGSEARDRRAIASDVFARLSGPYQAVVDSVDEAEQLATALAAESRAARSGIAIDQELQDVLLSARSDQRFVDASANLAARIAGYNTMIANLGDRGE